MDSIIKRYFKLLVGLFLSALGMVVTINANLGYSPWDVFHQGLGNIFTMQIGTANIITGLVILAIGIMNGQRPGIGTILNMVLIGSFMNIVMNIGLIPIFSNLYIRLLTIPVGMLIIGLGSYLYIGAGFGAGPRDGLMLMLVKKTGKSVRFIRNAIEISVLVVGYLLGGPVGVGTVIVSFGLGYALQFVFDLFKFDPNAVVHRDFDDEVKAFKNIIKSKSN